MSTKIDWSALKAKKPAVMPLDLIVFGSSGSGKSTMLGTLGVDTLILHGTREHHSVTNARLRAETWAEENDVDVPNVVGIDYVVLNDAGAVNYSLSFKNLLEILKDSSVADNFGAICLDGWYELQTVVQNTAAWKDFCATDRGGHNKYKEGDATQHLFNEVRFALLNLRRKNMHLVTTCTATQINNPDNPEDLQAKPALLGFNTAEMLVGGFADVLFVSAVKGDSKMEHKLVFNSTTGIESRDEKGKLKKVSFSNFKPRISGIKDLPDIADADLSKIIKARLK